jgi:hypothetical protein
VSLRLGCVALILCGLFTVWLGVFLEISYWPALVPYWLPIRMKVPIWGEGLIYIVTLLSEYWLWVIAYKPGAFNRMLDLIPIATSGIGLVLLCNIWYYSERSFFWSIALGVSFIFIPLGIKRMVYKR